jgi:hypothetical protein
VPGFIRGRFDHTVTVVTVAAAAIVYSSPIDEPPEPFRKPGETAMMNHSMFTRLAATLAVAIVVGAAIDSAFARDVGDRSGSHVATVTSVGGIKAKALTEANTGRSISSPIRSDSLETRLNDQTRLIDHQTRLNDAQTGLRDKRKVGLDNIQKTLDTIRELNSASKM